MKKRLWRLDEAPNQTGARIRELREAQGISLEELGSAIGVTRQQMGRLELGERNLKAAQVAALAARLGVPQHRLMEGTSPVDRAAELLKLMGYEVQAVTTVFDDFNAPFASDLVATLATSCIKLKLVCQVRLSTTRDDVQRLVDFVRRSAYHKGAIICEAAAPKEVIEFAQLRGLTVFTIEELAARLVNVGPYVEDLCRQAQPARTRYVLPEIRLEQGGEVVSLDTMIDRWLDTREPSHLLLVGEAGVGKTRACYAIAERLGRRYLADPLGNPAPILVRLWEYPYVQQPLDLLFKDIEARCPPAVPCKPGLRRMLEDGRFVLLLDGLDEMSARLDPYVLRRNLKALSTVLSTRSRAIITARRGTFRKDDDVAELLLPHMGGTDRASLVAVPRLMRGDLLPFGQAQITSFLKQRSPRAWQESLRWIESIGLWEFASLPLILEQLPTIFVHKEPRHRSDLRTLPAVLEEVVQALAGEEDTLPADELIALWESVAQVRWRENQPLVDLDKLNDDKRSVLRRSPEEEVRAHRGDQGLGTSAVLIEDGSGQVRFTHQLYYQYLLLRRVFRKVQEGSETILCNFWFDRELARLARPMVTKTTIKSRLSDWLRWHPEESVRGTCAYLLGLGGEREIIPVLRDVFAGDDDPSVRSTAAHGLAQLGQLDVIRDLGAQACAGLMSTGLARMQLMILLHEEWDDPELGDRVRSAIRAEMRGWSEGDVKADLAVVLVRRDESEPRRCIAARVAGLLGDEKARNALEELRTLPSYRLRSAASEALEELSLRSSSRAP